ncbi:MAG: hypothetical protein J1F66_02400 [Clostridiales bacterium]|nr:hypothetical protein [Clostridiales bacterium]
MKSRRVLQVIVAVLSLAVLVCMLLSAAFILAANHVDFLPNEVRDLTENFTSGLNAISNSYGLESVVVPGVAFGLPALLLLLALILILAKNRGKDGKNIVGCIFSLIGVLILTAFLILFAEDLFAQSYLYPVWGASGGSLALFVIFVGCALGVRPKKAPIAEFDETPENHAVVEETAEEVAIESIEEITAVSEEEREEIEPTEHEEVDEDIKELNSELTIAERVREMAVETAKVSDTDESTPATKYVPHESVTIRDVVEETYGKEGDSLSSATLQRINKVRALYEAKVITEQEYIKLINKYLGF